MTDKGVPSFGMFARPPLAVRGANGPSAAAVAAARLEVERARTARFAQKAIDLAFCVVYGLIGLEINLELLEHGQRVGLSALVHAVTLPLIAPFDALLSSSGAGAHGIGTSLAALTTFAMLHVSLRGILRVFADGTGR